ncbi:MAG: hypothetical protein WCO82_00715 [Sphingomonadales bacterium]
MILVFIAGNSPKQVAFNRGAAMKSAVVPLAPAGAPATNPSPAVRLTLLRGRVCDRAGWPPAGAMPRWFGLRCRLYTDSVNVNVASATFGATMLSG